MESNNIIEGKKMVEYEIEIPYHKRIFNLLKDNYIQYFKGITLRDEMVMLFRFDIRKDAKELNEFLDLLRQNHILYDIFVYAFD